MWKIGKGMMRCDMVANAISGWAEGIVSGNVAYRYTHTFQVFLNDIMYENEGKKTCDKKNLKYALWLVIRYFYVWWSIFLYPGSSSSIIHFVKSKRMAECVWQRNGLVVSR